MKNTFFYYTEKWYPFVGSLIVVIIIVYYGIPYNSIGIEKLLNGAITFSSIIVGLIAVLLSIIASIRNTEIVEYLFENTKKDDFKGYFRIAIITGLLTVINSSIMFLINYKWLYMLWVFILVLFILSSYRIIELLLRIIFTDPKATNLLPNSNRLNEVERLEIRKKYTKQ